VILWLMARPALLVGVLALGLIGVRETMDFFEDRGFRARIEELTRDLAGSQSELLKVGLALETEKHNVDTLKSDVAAAKAKADAAQARARQQESSANLRVARALRTGAEQTAALLAETTRVPPGHEAMNTWLQERIGP
jgi:chromosome segregation ATPase